MACTIFVAAVLLGVLSVVSASPTSADTASPPDLPNHLVEQKSLCAPFSKPSFTSLPVIEFQWQAEHLMQTYSRYGQPKIYEVKLAGEGGLDGPCHTKQVPLCD
jgi:hypothetical protein